MREFEQDKLVHARPERSAPARDEVRSPVRGGVGSPVRGEVRSPVPGRSPGPGPSPVPGRSPGLDAASMLHLQRTAGNQGVLQMLAGDEERSPVHDVVGSGGGAPLDASTRSSMESAFGASFGDVRVHTDGAASRSAERVGANAYTVGSDVVFKSGQYDPSSAAGQRTIAHELSHVVQQSKGPVDGTATPGGIRVSDPSDAFERSAEATADEVMASVQRSPEEEEPEEEAQG